jgi:hypothetical protein
MASLSALLPLAELFFVLMTVGKIKKAEKLIVGDTPAEAQFWI